MGEKKTLKKKQNKTTEKFPICLPSHPPVYDMETDCFPVSESIENKLDLP